MFGFINRLIDRIKDRYDCEFGSINTSNIRTVGELVRVLNTFPKNYRFAIYDNYNGQIIDVFKEVDE